MVYSLCFLVDVNLYQVTTVYVQQQSAVVVPPLSLIGRYLRGSRTSEDIAGPPRQREERMPPITPTRKRYPRKKACNILGLEGDLDDKKKEGN